MTRSISSSLAALFALFIISPAAHAWSQQDTIWETAYLAAHVADWGQTRDIAKQCASSGNYKESNTLLGECPSGDAVNAYFLGTALLHAGAAHMLPRKYRRMFQVGTLGMQLNVINSNKQIGLKVSF
jgi:hypothetical protein